MAISSEIMSVESQIAVDNQPAFSSDLDVVIVNYNTKDLLRACLQSIFNSECNFRLRVLVVDNASKDDSVAMVEREFVPRYDNLTLIASSHNGGFSYGNNLALRRICPLPETNVANDSAANQLCIGCQPQARYVVLLNPDTVVPPDAFQKMYDFMQMHPAAGVVGPKLVRANGQLDLACRRSFPTPAVSFYRMLGLSKLFPHNPRFARYNLTFRSPDELCEIDSVCGAFMMIRAEALQQAGLLDETFFMYGEDLDWAFRIKAHGWKVFYNPATTVIHYKGESSKQRSVGAIINFYDAMHVFYRKHYAAQTFFLLNWLIIFGIFARCGLALTINFFRPKKRKRVS